MWEVVINLLAAFGADWASLKTYLQHSGGVSHDTLHVLLGVFMQLIIARITRKSAGDVLPWLAVFGLELLNEINDFNVERWPNLAMQLGEGTKDIVLTMILPTLLLLLVRYRSPVLAREGSAR